MTISLAFSGLFTGSQVFAESLKDKLNENQQEQSANQQEKEETKENLNEVLENQKQVSEEIDRLNNQIAEAKDKISSKEAEIKQTRENIDQLKKEIEALKQRIAERDELLKDRVRAMYQNGGPIEYIDVLMGAESFGNLLERVMSLNTIAEQDRKILKQHIADKKAVEDKKAQVEEELSSLKDNLAQLETLKKKLDANKQEKDSFLASLEQKEAELHDHVMEIEEENATLAAQEKAIQQEIERQRKAAEEAARREAERKAAAEAAAAAERAAEKEAERQAVSAAEKKSNSSSSSNSGASSTPASNGGGSDFIWPASAPASSEYGMRVHPISGATRLHSGIDLARAGTVPIRASASGTVIRANYSSSYGNVVFISHQINGQTFTTLYAHMSGAPKVSAGQSVSQGQLLGYMGSTGDSTGQHLHFEIHEGPWNGSRSNSVNPRIYLP